MTRYFDRENEASDSPTQMSWTAQQAHRVKNKTSSIIAGTPKATKVCRGVTLSDSCPYVRVTTDSHRNETHDNAQRTKCHTCVNESAETSASLIGQSGKVAHGSTCVISLHAVLVCPLAQT
eukprot:6464890-Amphidinium_carterae.5